MGGATSRVSPQLWVPSLENSTCSLLMPMTCMVLSLAHTVPTHLLSPPGSPVLYIPVMESALRGLLYLCLTEYRVPKVGPCCAVRALLLFVAE